LYWCEDFITCFHCVTAPPFSFKKQPEAMYAHHKACVSYFPGASGGSREQSDGTTSSSLASGTTPSSLPQWKNTADEPLEVSPMNSSNWGDALPIFFEESSTCEYSSEWKKAHDAYRRRVAKRLLDDASSSPVVPAKSPTHCRSGREYSSKWKKARDDYRRRVAKLLTPAASSLPTDSSEWKKARDDYRRRVAKLLTPAASSLPTESAQSPDERQNHRAT
jgi:hypothetical protein